MSHPTIVIINGANWIGTKLVELMLEQKGNVIVVDDFNPKSMPFLKRFGKSKHFVFIEKDKIQSIRENFAHIKYFIHLKHDFDTSDDQISSKNFLEETKFVDEALSIALEKKSSYILTSSIHLHKDFLLKKNYARDDRNEAYTESDLQDYIEKMVLEYVKKAGLDGRIARLGNVYGPGMDLEKDPLLKQILSDAFHKEEVRIYGDGLEYMYYIYISDAIQGILKALFSADTHGDVYSITNPEEVSVLTIVNKLLALQPKAKGIKFLKAKYEYDPLYEKAYIPEENLTKIGWSPKVSFDRGIAQIVDFFGKDSTLGPTEFDAKEEGANFPTKASAKPENEVGNINLSFDDTINLSNPGLGQPNSEFNDFYRKLNAEDSPIYNKNKSKGLFSQSSPKVYESSPKEKKTLRDYLKLLSLSIFFVFIYLFFIVPIVRTGILFWNIKQDSTEITNFITKKTKDLKSTNLTGSASDNLGAMQWMIKATNQEDLEVKILNTSKGLDNAARAAIIIESGNLSKYLNNTTEIVENDVSRIRDLLIILSSAKSQLSDANQLNLPFEASKNIAQIKSWVEANEKSYTTLLAK